MVEGDDNVLYLGQIQVKGKELRKFVRKSGFSRKKVPIIEGKA
jgi:hypothetical protein